MGWEGEGAGAVDRGGFQGSPLSLVLFLVWMAPILSEMGRRIVEAVPGVVVELDRKSVV